MLLSTLKGKLESTSQESDIISHLILTKFIKGKEFFQPALFSFLDF